MERHISNIDVKCIIYILLLSYVYQYVSSQCTHDSNPGHRLIITLLIIMYLVIQ